MRKTADGFMKNRGTSLTKSKLLPKQKPSPVRGEGGCERSEQTDEGAGKQQLTGNYPLIRLYPKKKANLF
jgi:hypothetical protein